MSGSVGNWGEENGLTGHGPGAFPPPCQATPALEKPIGHSCCLLQKPQIPKESRELGPSNQPTRGHFCWSAFVRARRNWFRVRNVFIFLSGRWNSINRTTKRNTEEIILLLPKFYMVKQKTKYELLISSVIFWSKFIVWGLEFKAFRSKTERCSLIFFPSYSVPSWQQPGVKFRLLLSFFHLLENCSVWLLNFVGGFLFVCCCCVFYFSSLDICSEFSGMMCTTAILTVFPGDIRCLQHHAQEDKPQKFGPC